MVLPERVEKSMVNNRHVVYTPATDFIGEDQFEYKLCASADPSNCSVSSVQISVLPPVLIYTPTGNTRLLRSI